MILGTAAAGLAMSAGGMIAAGLGITANRVINKKSEYEMKKLENEDYLKRQNLMGQQQKAMYEAKAEAERKLEETKFRGENEKLQITEDYKYRTLQVEKNAQQEEMKLNNESKKIDYQNQQALKTIENDFILKKQENENKAQIKLKPMK